MILVVFLFLRSVRSTIIPSVAVPVSLIATLGVMYLCGFSIDNLSLMALTVATGFVVDDAIVVIENITRHLEEGMAPFEAALAGAKQIGFTVFSISISLVAVFIPILLMGGIVGRLFREFAVTLSVAILISMVVSLTTTPMMCARLLKRPQDEKHGRLFRASERVFDAIVRFYERTLTWVLRHQPLTLAVTLATMAATVFLYARIPKGFFPQQDAGRLTGTIQADQDTSFQAMQGKLAPFHRHRPARSGRRERERLPRRRPHEQRTDVRVAEAEGAAQADRGRGHREAAPAARPGSGGHARPPAGAGHPRRRPARAPRSISTRCAATTPRSCSSGRRRCTRGCDRCAS